MHSLPSPPLAGLQGLLILLFCWLLFVVHFHPPEQQSWNQRRRHNSTGQSRRRASLVFQIQVLVVSQSVSNHLYPTATVIAMDPRPYQDSAMLGLLSLTLAT